MAALVTLEDSVMTDEYRAVVTSAQLDAIVTVECSAKRISGEEVSDFTVEIKSGSRQVDSGIAYRFEVSCHPKDIAGDLVAEIVVVMIVQYSFETMPTTPQLVMQFAEDVAFMTTYPYCREAIQSLAARIGIESLTLEILKRGQFHLFSED